MSRKSDPIELAADRLAQAKEHYDRVVEEYRAAAATEPADRRAVRFVLPGARWHILAIRADNYRGNRRWFVTENADFPVFGDSPVAWADIARVAEPGSIEIAPLGGWERIAGNLEGGPNVSGGSAPRITFTTPGF